MFMSLANNNGESCLHIAAQEGRLEVVKALVEEGGKALLLQTDDDHTVSLYTAV